MMALLGAALLKGDSRPSSRRVAFGLHVAIAGRDFHGSGDGIKGAGAAQKCLGESLTAGGVSVIIPQPSVSAQRLRN